MKHFLLKSLAVAALSTFATTADAQSHYFVKGTADFRWTGMQSGILSCSGSFGTCAQVSGRFIFFSTWNCPDCAGTIAKEYDGGSKDEPELIFELEGVEQKTRP